MIVHRRITWLVIAVLILLAFISSSTSVKLRKLRKRSTTTRALYQQFETTPTIIKVIHKYTNDELTRDVPSLNCTHNNCGNARDKSDKALFNQDNFRKHKKITLQKFSKHTKLNLSKSLSRTKRNLGNDYLAGRNTSDYYAQRKAVMDRYYARQREINTRYANRTADSVTKLRYNGVPQHYSMTNNATRFRIEYGYLNKNSTTERTISRYPQINLMDSRETLSNRIPTELSNRRDIAPENDLDSKSDADFVQSRNNIERNALNYFTTTSCGPLSGTVAPKTRQKSKQCRDTEEEEEKEEENEESSENSDNHENKRWGECKGTLVYQHNLHLGLTLNVASNIDTMFEVFIEDSICITCVETLRYNETRAKVTLVFGGPGSNYAKLKLEGYKNEGFFYIIKIWGVRKVGRECE